MIPKGTWYEKCKKVTIYNYLRILKGNERYLDVTDTKLTRSDTSLCRDTDLFEFDIKSNHFSDWSNVVKNGIVFQTKRLHYKVNFEHLSHFRRNEFLNIWIICDHFSKFWTLLNILVTFEHFGHFWTILALLNILVTFGHFWTFFFCKFWTI